MMKKALFCLLLYLCALLCACSPQTVFQPETAALPEGEKRISAAPESSDAREFDAALYFRFADTALLRQETRRITLSPNETREKALVNALIDGAQLAGGTALFPEGTQVLSTQMQDGIIFVTFNDAIYERYPGESDQFLLRNLAMAALTATLTESGEGRSVQVLVRSESNVTSSMRLKASFFGASTDAAVAPLTREDAYLPTPAVYAAALLSSWQQRDWYALAPFITLRSEAAAQRMTMERFESAPLLLQFTVHTGTVSLDGGSAVVSLDLTLQNPDGSERVRLGYPLRFMREDGAWKLGVKEAAALMEVQND